MLPLLPIFVVIIALFLSVAILVIFGIITMVEEVTIQRSVVQSYECPSINYWHGTQCNGAHNVADRLIVLSSIFDSNYEDNSNAWPMGPEQSRRGRAIHYQQLCQLLCLGSEAKLVSSIMWAWWMATIGIINGVVCSTNANCSTEHHS